MLNMTGSSRRGSSELDRASCKVFKSTISETTGSGIVSMRTSSSAVLDQAAIQNRPSEF